MEVRGLANEPQVIEYLARRYRLTHESSIAGLPIFKDQKGEFYIGVFKGFYSICIGDTTELRSELKTWRQNRTCVHYVFSTDRPIFSKSRLDLVLKIPEGMHAEDRLSLYARNVQKHVRRVANSSLTYTVGSPPTGWYKIYLEAMTRKGTIARPEEYFQQLGDNFGEKIVAFAVYDVELLVGCLYCFVTSDYIQLCYIASDPSYRLQRVDNGLYDKAIIYAIEHGLHFVDFGPTMYSDQGHWSIKVDYGAEKFYFADISFMHPYKKLKKLLPDGVRRLRRKTSFILRNLQRSHYSSIPQ